MIVATDTATWDLIGQLGVWIIGFPLFLTILGGYIYAQIVIERRENQQLSGRWGLAAKTSRDKD